MSWWAQLNLMDPASLVQSEMLLFHDHALMIISGIFILVSVVGWLMLKSTFSSRRVYEAQTLEIIWTVLPALLLLTLALPSLRLLYLVDEHSMDCKNTLKVVGHQWYWSYENPFLGNENFDSYMLPPTDPTWGGYRLLDVDKRVVLPVGVDSSVVATSVDVIHAWALPSLGVKMDSVPGRLNMMSVTPLLSGVYYGQCSEICGANHAFMPIVVESIPVMHYLNI
uniref:Cytochrome c oxidase subunit 2 n=3 Tax=Polygyridae TaxID=56129 RepID=A0A1J0MRQ9_9EUPU|nr:cytochrome c oxidase subunit II [Polygyra cereolus]YP_009328203.1 cytochrome c oxidase subunit II [Praticolella mexicana]APD28044.1 cytochrome c oxidase subunit II [Praticolella mexicana]APD28057.1 cytochrome c oxidase subunit II [Polygyra cereolus]